MFLTLIWPLFRIILISLYHLLSCLSELVFCRTSLRNRDCTLQHLSWSKQSVTCRVDRPCLCKISDPASLLSEHPPGLSVPPPAPRCPVVHPFSTEQSALHCQRGLCPQVQIEGCEGCFSLASKSLLASYFLILLLTLSNFMFLGHLPYFCVSLSPSKGSLYS